MGFSVYGVFLIVATLVALWALLPIWGEKNTVGQITFLLALTLSLVGILTGSLAWFLVDALAGYTVPPAAQPGKASYLLPLYIIHEGVKIFQREISLFLTTILDVFVSSIYILYAAYIARRAALQRAGETGSCLFCVA